MLLAMHGVARAEPIPDASLRAVKDRSVRFELDGAPAVEGRLLGFEAETITLARAATNEVVSLPRKGLLRVIDLSAATATAVAEPAPIEPQRIVGVQFSMLGTIAADVDYTRLHAFASTNLLLPIVTGAGSNTWFTAALGAGVSIPLSATSRWKLDIFGQVLPLHTTSFYTYLGLGAGAGFHYTASSGFTLGFTMPVLGFAARLGSSPYGYDAAFRYNDSIGYYYLAAFAGMPIVTMGYRFATKQPKTD